MLPRDAGEVGHFRKILDRDGFPLRHRRRLQAQVASQLQLHAAICFEVFDQLFHTTYIQSNRNSVKQKLSVRRYGINFYLG